MTGGQEYTLMLARCRFWRVALILVAAAALRLWGLRWGLPDSMHLFSYHPDEFHSLRGVLSLATGDLNPHFFNYGSLYLYLVSALCVIAHSSLVFGLDIGTLPEAIRVFTLDARIVSAAAGIATVYVVYLIGRRLESEKAGLVAAAALAVMPLHVLNCHYGTVDVTQTLFIALCLYFTLGIIEGEGLRAWMLAGAMAGLAASTKYNGILVVIAPVVAGVVRPRPYPARCAGTPPVPGGERQTAILEANGERDESRFQPKWMLLGALACFGATLIAFAVTSPYTFLAWNEAKSGIAFELQHTRNGEWPATAIWPSGWLFHLYLSVCLFPVAFVLTDRATRRKLTPALAFGALWYVVISLAKVRYARYGVPLDIVAALAIALLWPGRWQSQPVKLLGQLLTFAGLSAFIAGWLVVSVQRDSILAGPCLQDQLLAEILQHVPPGESVGMVWEPWFNVPPVDYCNGGAALRNNPLWARFKRPLRPIVVTGLDADKLRQERPYAFVAGGADLLFAQQCDPASAAMMRALRADDYNIYQRKLFLWPDTWWQQPQATDTTYACPFPLELMVRNKPATPQ